MHTHSKGLIDTEEFSIRAIIRANEMQLYPAGTTWNICLLWSSLIITASRISFGSTNAIKSYSNFTPIL